MRVFVVGTGRCGTSTFYQACKHIHNFTAGHESKAGAVHSYHYPDNHIEVASQISIAIPRVMDIYPQAKWVHLVRDRDKCVKSLARQCYDEMQCFCQQWFLCKHPLDVIEAAASFYDSTNRMIDSVLSRTHHQKIHIETASQQWPEFIRWIGAECDKEAALQELSRSYNPGTDRGRDNYVEA